MSLLRKLTLLVLLLPLLFIIASSFFTQKAHAAVGTAVVGGLIFIDNDEDGEKDTNETTCYPAVTDASKKVKIKVGSANAVAINSTANCSQGYSFSSSVENKSVSIVVPPGYRGTGLTITDENGRRVLRGATSVGASGRAVIHFGVKAIKEECARRNPVLTRRSTTNNNNNKVYNLTIENKDSANCSARSFILDRELNSGWNGIFLQEESSSGQLYSIVVQPNGGTKDFRFRVTPPDNAGDGDWIVRAIAKATNGDSGNINLSYKIGNPPTSIPIPSNPPPPPDCDRKAPLFEVTEPQNGERTGKRGEERKYTLKVTNRDSGKCDDQIFVLSKERVPNNFTAKLDETTLKIQKGGHKSTTLHVTPQNDAAKGRSTVNISLKRQGKDKIRDLTLGYTVEVKNPPPTAKPTKKPTAKPTKKPTDGPAPTTCARKTPEFSATPDSRTGDPGKGVKYTMVIKNKDQGPCAVRKLSLGAKLPTSTWKGVFAKESLDLAKGAQATIDVAITSPNGATPGNKKITLNLKNNEGTIINTKDVSYVVTGFDGNGLISVWVGIDGIGTTPRIPIGGNKNPVNANRNITLRLFDTVANTSTEGWTDWTFTYNPSTQKFESQLGLSNDFPTGTYNVYAEGPRFIRARLPGSATITKGQTTNIHSDNFYLITGNINNSDLSENRVDIMDYSVLISCSIYSQDFSLCEEDPNYATYSDLNDDGRVDEDDYTLFLKEFGNEGAILP